MADIDKIRKLFTSPEDNEDKIIFLFRELLRRVDRKKQGTIIGKKKHVDYNKLMNRAIFSENMLPEKKVIDQIIGMYDGVPLWSHPQTQVNVIPPPTDISIAAAALISRYNENSIWDHYGMSASQSEVIATGMLADLIGFDKSGAGGIFTFGGTGCNLYAARIGVEKADPDAKNTGIRDRIQFFCSDISHYSIKSSAIWTGVGLNNIKAIASNDDNSMKADELESAMLETLKNKARIGTIFVTMGTTDAFGIDPLKKIVRIRDKIQKKLSYKIHIHADAVIGWPYLTFKGDKNIKRFSEPLRKEIMTVVSKMAELKYADSVGIDFHKTGWTPYLCSAIVFKNVHDLFLLQKFKKDMPYLYHGKGYQPGMFTLESSRPNYAQKALVNMLLLGRQGYEVLISHLLSVSDYLRDKIEKCDDIALLNRHNPAFVTDFRFYPDSKYNPVDGKLQFKKELHDKTSKRFTDRINNYNKKIVQQMIHCARVKGTSLESYTDAYKTTSKKRMIVAIKSYPMSPFTDNKHMDILLQDLYAAKATVDVL